MKRLFDCHCDTLTKVMECEQNLIENNMQIDIARLSEFESATEILPFGLMINILQRLTKTQIGL